MWRHQGGWTESCKRFLALDTAVVVVDPARIESPWAGVRGIHLPATVTRLEFCSSMAPKFRGDRLPLLDLHSMLSYAVCCIDSGVPLQHLRCAHCMTAVPQHVYYGDVGPDARDAMELVEADYVTLSGFYGGVGRRLRGLAALDLSESPDCGQAAVKLVVAAAPDLQHLSLAWRGVWHGVDAVRSAMCAGLHALDVRYHVSSGGQSARREPGSHRKLAVTLQLAEASSLNSCLVRLSGEPKAGDSVSIVVDCDAAASITPTYTKGEEAWQLACTLHVPEKGRRWTGTGQDKV